MFEADWDDSVMSGVRVNVPLRAGMMASRVFGHGGLPDSLADLRGEGAFLGHEVIPCTTGEIP